MSLEVIISIVVLIVSSVLHEIAHAYAAYMEGDDTPKRQNRLSLNPLRHLDPIGSFIIPSLLVLTKTGLIFGWARPVEFNPKRFEDRKWGPVFVGMSGPFVNLSLALMAGLVLRFAGNLGIDGNEVAMMVASNFVVINTVLFLFNIFPAGPLDGHYIGNLFKIRLPFWIRRYKRYFSGAVFAAFLVLSYKFMGDVVVLFYRLFTGF